MTEHLTEEVAFVMQGADRQYVTQIPHVRDILALLHQRLNNGEEVQHEIDRYLLLCFLECNQSHIIQQCEYSSLVLSSAHVLSVSDLPDIGKYIRSIFTLSTADCSSAMLKLVNYCIPFVKHNRLTFPMIQEFVSTDMHNILQIVLASLVGLFPTSRKHPLFYNRVFIFGYIHSLMAEHSVVRMHAFCETNIHIVRLALMEYLLYFLQTYMPAEYELMSTLFDISIDLSLMLVHLRMCIDNFRQLSLQTHMEGFTAINMHAQTCNDRCNRICKGKFRSHKRSLAKVAGKVIAPTTVRLALQAPLQTHVYYLHQMYPHEPPHVLEGIARVQNNIKVYNLPANMAQTQREKLQCLIMENAVTTLRSVYLHYCTLCQRQENIVDNMLRMDGNMCVRCNHCEQSEFMIKINSVGRFIVIGQQTLIFCHKCARIHAWHQACDKKTTSLLTTTQAAAVAQRFPSASRPQRVKSNNAYKCVLCFRTVNLSAIKLLNDDVGFMYDVLLCKRHMPLPWTIRNIVTIRCLALEILFKREYYKKKHDTGQGVNCPQQNGQGACQLASKRRPIKRKRQ